MGKNFDLEDTLIRHNQTLHGLSEHLALATGRAAGVPRPGRARGSLGEWPLEQPCSLEKLSSLHAGSQAPVGPLYPERRASTVLGNSIPQSLEGKKGKGEMLQVTGWRGPARQGIGLEGSSAQANAQGASQLGLERGDARYFDVGLQTSDKNRLGANLHVAPHVT